MVKKCNDVFSAATIRVALENEKEPELTEYKTEGLLKGYYLCVSRAERVGAGEPTL